MVKDGVEEIINTTERFTRFLKVKLLDGELRDRVRTLGERIKEQTAKEEEKSVIMKRLGEELQKIRGQIAELSNVIATGEEDHNVNCESRKNFKEGTFTVTRLDTMDEIEKRALYDYEKQQGLPLNKNVTLNDERVTLGSVARVTDKRKRKDVDGPEDEDSEDSEPQEKKLKVVKRTRYPKEPDVTAWGEGSDRILTPNDKEDDDDRN